MAGATQSGSVRQGNAGTVILSGRVRDVEESPEFRGENWYGTPTKIGFAQIMARDARVRRCDYSYSAPIRRATPGMDPGADDPRAREAAAFAEWAFFKRLPWDDFVRLSLTDSQYGAVCFECTDDVVDLPAGKFPLHPGGGRGIVYTGLHHVPRWSIFAWEPRADNPTELAAVVQWPDLTGKGKASPRIDGSRILRFTYDQEGGNFDGFPLWRSAAASVLIKRQLRILKAIWHERTGLGTPMIELPLDAKEGDVEKAEEILAEMRAHEKGYLVLPNGFKFSWSSGGATTNMDEAIAYCDREIEFAFGANFLSLGSGPGPGSYALSSTLDGHHELMVETRALERLNKLSRGSDGWSPLRRLIDLNYGPDVALPEPVLRDLPTNDWSSSMPIIRDLIAQKAITIDQPLRAFIRRVFKLPPEDPTTAAESREPPALTAPAPSTAPSPTPPSDPEPAQ